MATKEQTGVKDFGQVDLVDVVPEPVTPVVPVPTPPEAPSPVQAAQAATIETTGADPPPRWGWWQYRRVHRKIWLWWGDRPIPWAAQLYLNRYVSLGFHFDWQRPLLDLHLLWLIVAIGRDPTVTSRLDRYRESCRGFDIEEGGEDSPLTL